MGFFTTIVLESLELGLISPFSREEQDPSYFLIMALNVAPVRDTKWLTLEVCRQFQRGTCSRSDEECKFAHPPKSCQVENGRVIACFDSLKAYEQGIRLVITERERKGKGSSEKQSWPPEAGNGSSDKGFPGFQA